MHPDLPIEAVPSGRPHFGADRKSLVQWHGSALTTLTGFARGLLDAANADSVYNALGAVPEANVPPRLRANPGSVLDLDAFFDAGFAAGPGDGAGHNGWPGGSRYWGAISATRNANSSGVPRGMQLAWAFSGGIPTLFFRTNATDTNGWVPWVPLVPEYGSNANGSYVRLADGTQICFKRFTPPGTINWTLSGGGNYYSDSYVTNWPANFSASPFIASGSEDYRARNTDANIGGYGLDYCAVYFTAMSNSTAGSNPSAHLIAVGRWY